MPDIAVIIPFFQQRPGLLSNALRSVCSQNVDCSIEVLVVDDESPIDPERDLPAGLPGRVTVRILRQSNGGPGTARNRGLDQVSPETTYVAFLDSDDAWEPNHLRNATAALGADLDFYFANHLEPDAVIDDFSRRQRIVPARHKRLPRGSNCYEFVGDMQDQIIRANVIETSTVVFRWSALRAIRFGSQFRHAFEDHLFWLEAAKASRGIAFSTDIECRYGRGVSIWRSPTLGGERAFLRMLDHLRFIRTLEAGYVRTGGQAQALRERVRELRASFVAELLHRARRRMTIDWGTAWQMIKGDPMLIVLCLPLAFQIFRKRMKAA